jgi:DMSO/TMAO reductase YedYZ molybdopterin-dependent catalytic subunit
VSSRRTIIKHFSVIAAGFLFFFNRAAGGLHLLWAATKRRVLERGTPMSELMHANPARVDISNLETTPIDEFDVMGETKLDVNLEEWHLTIDGEVRNSVKFSYQELLSKPVIERNVLLVCPGFFAYNGLWKGFSLASLLQEAGLKPGATAISFSGSKGFRKKTRRYPLEEVMNDKIFIAYEVNGQQLPQRHGFPMRLVAEDYKGRFWIKYLKRVEVVD